MPHQSTQASIANAPFRWFALATAGLALAFIVPLGNLIRFAAGDDLHSHIVLIPFISVYLAWLQKKNLPGQATPAKKLAALFFAGGGAVLAWHWWANRSGHPLAGEDRLALTTLAFVLWLTGLGALFLGGARLRALAFPFALLVFMIPLPVCFREWTEVSPSSSDYRSTHGEHGQHF